MQVKQVKQRIPSFQENAWIVRLYPRVTGTGHSIRSFPITRPVMRTREFEIDSALDVVRAEACTPNWNGEGAKKVSILSLRLVKELLRTAPAWVPLPEIGGDPDGAVGMDWFHDKDRLSVSVYDNRE